METKKDKIRDELTGASLLKLSAIDTLPYFAYVGKQKHLVRCTLPVFIDRVGSKIRETIEIQTTYSLTLLPELDIPQEKYAAFWTVWSHLNLHSEYFPTEQKDLTLWDKLHCIEFIIAFDIQDPSDVFYDTYAYHTNKLIVDEVQGLCTTQTIEKFINWCKLVLENDDSKFYVEQLLQDITRLRS
jgi:hypothetical protein